MNASRQQLPPRRPSETKTVNWADTPFHITVGFDHKLRPKEVFASGGKPGTAMAHILSDACVVVSVALQSGVSITDLSKTLGEIPDLAAGEYATKPASPIGVIVAALADAQP